MAKNKESIEKVLIKNNFYPEGITNFKLKEYYTQNKNKILTSVLDAPVLLFMMYDNSKEPTVVRKYNGDLIKLNSGNYDKLITNRVLSISYEPNHKNLFKLIFDLDCVGKKCNSDLIRAIDDIIFKFDFEKIVVENKLTYKIFPSSTGFHLIFNNRDLTALNIKKSITSREDLISIMEKELLNIFPYKNYSINKKIKKNNKMSNVNIDLSPMNKRGSITAPYALTRKGTMYIPITDGMNSFNKKNYLI